MALVMAALHDAFLYGALRSAGAGDESARKAAEEVAACDDRLARRKSRLALVRRMIGFNLAPTAAVLAKLIV